MLQAVRQIHWPRGQWIRTSPSSHDITTHDTSGLTSRGIASVFAFADEDCPREVVSHVACHPRVRAERAPQVAPLRVSRDALVLERVTIPQFVHHRARATGCASRLYSTNSKSSDFFTTAFDARSVTVT